MAKRTQEDTYRPLDASLVSSVLVGNAMPISPPEQEAAEPLAAAMPELPPQPVRHEAAMPPRDITRRELPTMKVLERQKHASTSMPFAERMEREKRVLLTPSEERALDRVVTNMGAELGTTLKLSHVLRSCIRLLINSEAELVERARATGRIIRPPNSDLSGLEAFERIVANLLHAGLKDSRPVR